MDEGAQKKTQRSAAETDQVSDEVVGKKLLNCAGKADEPVHDETGDEGEDERYGDFYDVSAEEVGRRWV